MPRLGPVAGGVGLGQRFPVSADDVEAPAQTVGERGLLRIDSCVEQGDLGALAVESGEADTGLGADCRRPQGFRLRGIDRSHRIDADHGRVTVELGDGPRVEGGREAVQRLREDLLALDGDAALAERGEERVLLSLDVGDPLALLRRPDLPAGRLYPVGERGRREDDDRPRADLGLGAVAEDGVPRAGRPRP